MGFRFLVAWLNLAVWLLGAAACDSSSEKTESGASAGTGPAMVAKRAPAVSQSAQTPDTKLRAADGQNDPARARNQPIDPEEAVRLKLMLSRKNAPTPPEVSTLPGGTEKPEPEEQVPEPVTPSTVKPPDARIYPQNIANRPVPRVGGQPWVIAADWLERHQRQLQAPGRARAKVVFLGDSITQGWRAAPAYREHFAEYAPLNLGIAGDYTQNVLWRIQQGTLDNLQPEVVVLLIGVNNLGGGFTPEQTAAGVQAVVAAVNERLPKTPLLLLAILPAKESPDDPLREKISETNRKLAKFAEPGRVIFQDVGSVLLESDGKISKDVMSDFLHPTPLGFERLSAAVAPFIEKLVGPD